MKHALAAAGLGTALSRRPPRSRPPPAAARHAMPVQIKLSAQHGSGESGTATLLDGAKGLIVRLRLADAQRRPAGPHPQGQLRDARRESVYPLKPAHDGFSETTVPGATLADLAKGTYAINVHKSTTELGTYVSCGNLAKAK